MCRLGLGLCLLVACAGVVQRPTPRTDPQTSPRLGTRTLWCEFKRTSELQLWASGKFPYARAHEDGISTLTSVDANLWLATRVAKGGWEFVGGVDPQRHPVIFMRRDTRINPIAEIRMGVSALVGVRDDSLVVTVPPQRLHDAGLTFTSGGEAKVECSGLATTQWIRSEPGFVPNAATVPGPVLMFSEPGGPADAVLRGVEVSLLSASGAFVEVSSRTYGFQLHGWVRQSDVTAPREWSPEEWPELGFITMRPCHANTTLPVSAVTASSRAVVGAVRAGGLFKVLEDLDTEFVVEPVNIDIRPDPAVQFRVPVADLECL